MNSEISDHGFHERLARLIGADEPFAWAKRAGIPSSTFSRFWNERTVPKSEHLCRIADYAGVSLDWLVRGIEPMRPGQETQTPSPVNEHIPANLAVRLPSPTDGRLLGRLVRGVMQVYEQAGGRIGIDQATELAAAHHDAIVSITDDEEQREMLASIALEKVRKDLLNAASDPGSSKRRA